MIYCIKTRPDNAEYHFFAAGVDEAYRQLVQLLKDIGKPEPDSFTVSQDKSEIKKMPVDDTEYMYTFEWPSKNLEIQVQARNYGAATAKLVIVAAENQTGLTMGELLVPETYRFEQLDRIA